jgi:hypothetical protein
MDWNYVPTKGTTGGILVGFKSDIFEIISWQGLELCAVAIVKNILDKVVWRLITIYDIPYEESKSKLTFLEKLDGILNNWQGPTMIGGDFNLVRNQKEKSNGVVNFHHMNAFNELINKWGLIEIRDPNRSFSWTNNQESPILTKLDRAMVSVDWDNKYPMAKVTMMPEGITDHNPLRVSFGEKRQASQPIFRLEK